MSKIGVVMLKIAAVYMVSGLLLGLWMAISKQFGMMSVHSHVNLLGWVTMGLTGLIYLVSPGCAQSRLASVHFGGHNIGLPTMMISLAFLTLGNAGAEKFVGIGSMIVMLSLVAFTVNVFRNLKKEDSERFRPQQDELSTQRNAKEH